MDSTELRVASGKRVSGTLRVPPSKSVTQRYLTLALLSRHPTIPGGDAGSGLADF
jgi:5-enolpyruvylshikimate-3-phosphate synthase